MPVPVHVSSLSCRWTGEPYQSQCELLKDGEVVATSLTANPLLRGTGDYWRLSVNANANTVETKPLECGFGQSVTVTGIEETQDNSTGGAYKCYMTTDAKNYPFQLLDAGTAFHLSGCLRVPSGRNGLAFDGQNDRPMQGGGYSYRTGMLPDDITGWCVMDADSTMPTSNYLSVGMGALASTGLSDPVETRMLYVQAILKEDWERMRALGVLAFDGDTIITDDDLETFE